MKILQFLSFISYLTAAQAADHHDFSEPKEVVIITGSGNKDVQKNLSEAEFPKLKTSIMYPAAGLYQTSKDAKVKPKGIVILFGGTGAKSKAFGIGASMSPLANKLLKMGYVPIAFQNPMYWRDERPDSERQSDVDYFGTTKAQTNWMYEAISFVYDNIPNDLQHLRERLSIGSRSTGTAVFLEIVSAYYHDPTKFSLVSKVKSHLAMGPLSHKEPDLGKWIATEKNDILTDPESPPDWIVHAKDRPIFEDMHYLVEKPLMFAVHHEAVPSIFFTVGALDEISPPEDQWRMIKEFSHGHPNIPVEIDFLDTRHNPVGSVGYAPDLSLPDKKIKVRTMERISALLPRFLSEDTSSRKVGLTENFSDGFWVALKSKGVCSELLFSK